MCVLIAAIPYHLSTSSAGSQAPAPKHSRSSSYFPYDGDRTIRDEAMVCLAPTQATVAIPKMGYIITAIAYEFLLFTMVKGLS